MKLFISFPDQSKSFCAGVEYGKLYDRMEKGETHVTNDGFPVRKENQELLKNTCHKLGYTYSFGAEYYGEWIEFTAFKIQTSKN
ncbi:hypothetical protein [Chryseobacterium lathyri]|uniref:hypothetical protein n=1 Tax=Chryseobacterium lathyri TaxID=395933 RepID=UPI001CBAE5E0|nr:hypothetical protein [Chryseobacterium lathyri]